MLAPALNALPLAIERLPATDFAQAEVVLLHGWGCDRSVWRPLVARLRPWANLTLIDLPGLAPAPPAPELTAPGLTVSALTPLGRSAPGLPGSEAGRVETLLAHCPPSAIYVGWSLGGQLALALAARAPHRVRAVVNLCGNPRFIAERGWAERDWTERGQTERDQAERDQTEQNRGERHRAARSWPGMAPATFARFADDVAADPSAALHRFDQLLVSGAASPRSLLRQFRGLRAPREPGAPQAGRERQSSREPDVCRIPEPRERAMVDSADALPGTDWGAGLTAGLDWLHSLDLRATLPTLRCPQLHLLAERDALVPAALADVLAPLLPDTGEIAVLPAASHLAPVECADAIADTLHVFLARRGLLVTAHPPVDAIAKTAVAASFSRAATVYDSAAGLQREVGERLLRQVDARNLLPRTVLDLGCGTGLFTAALTARFPAAHHLGLDLAEGMARHARQRAMTAIDSLTGDRAAGDWLVGDAESLPLASDSVDLVFSSLALQWCARPELFLAELARVLRPGGVALFTTLGPRTLRELRAAWAAVDARQHVNRFLPAAELTRAAAALPGVRLTLTQALIERRHTGVRELLAELKTLGAHNMTQGRPRGLTGRHALQQMAQAYESCRCDGRLPATWELYCGVLEKA